MREGEGGGGGGGLCVVKQVGGYRCFSCIKWSCRDPRAHCRPYGDYGKIHKDPWKNKNKHTSRRAKTRQENFWKPWRFWTKAIYAYLTFSLYLSISASTLSLPLPLSPPFSSLPVSFSLSPRLSLPFSPLPAPPASLPFA